MLVTIIYNFINGFVEKRQPFRQAHLEYIRSYESRGKVAAGGALSPELCRGLILFRGTLDEADEFARNDPYLQSGIVENYMIGEWLLVVGDASQHLRA